MANPPSGETFNSIDSKLTHRGSRWILFYLVLAIVVPVVYVTITHHVWEDYLITFRHSKNLVEGNGLVYNPGHRVQGFTSAINVMLPAIFYAISGRNDVAALNFYRAVCLAGYVLGGLICLRLILKDRGVDRLSPLFFILLYVTEAKTVAFTMNGQESAFMILFLSIGFAVIYNGIAARWWVAGLSWAGLMYTRPDSAVYISCLALVALAFEAGNRRAVFVAICKSAGLALAIYLPWLIWTWFYYGQPIPNTVLAKSNFGLSNLENPARTIQLVLGNYPINSSWVFEPIYAYMGGWPNWLLDGFGLGCSIICTCYWLIPSADRLGRMASLLFMLGALYMSFIESGSLAYPWYMPSVAFFGLIVLARAPVAIARSIPLVGQIASGFGRSIQTIVVVVSLLFLTGQTLEMSIQQTEVEDNGRKQIGLFLHDVVRPGDRIFLEPIGYIGYYSDRYIVDWPGLVSPQIVRMKRDHPGLGQMTAIPLLKPEWLVLRRPEALAAAENPEIKKNYSTVREFNVMPNLDRYSYIPGDSYLYLDAWYYVLRRNDVPMAKAGESNLK
jgi:hypothetical protein